MAHTEALLARTRELTARLETLRHMEVETLRHTKEMMEDVDDRRRLKAEEEEQAEAAVALEMLHAPQEEGLLRASQQETARRLAEAQRLQEVAAAASEAQRLQEVARGGVCEVSPTAQ